MQVMFSVAELDGVEVLHTDADDVAGLAAYLMTGEGQLGLLVTLRYMADRPQMRYTQPLVPNGQSATHAHFLAYVTSPSSVFEETMHVCIKEVQPLHL